MLYNRAVPGGCAAGIYNASISIIHVYEEMWSIKVWNDISHLRETGFLKLGSVEGGSPSPC
ncbi:Phosphoglycerate mutase-like protein 4 [Bienertia sinuspersici]